MVRLLEAASASCAARAVLFGNTIFVAQYEDESEAVLNYIVERKMIENFLSSDRSAFDLCNQS